MNYNKIIFATSNQHKMYEIKSILSDLGIEILAMNEVGINVDVVEDGKTFAENALIKVKAIGEIVRQRQDLKDSVVLSDDSGLVVDGLDGEPGIYSARYMGEDTSYRIKNANIIDRLNQKGLLSKEERSARFVCAIAACMPDGNTLSTEGYFEGYIGDSERGENGFGYDPIFMVKDRDVASAELSEEVKNQLSHRGQALEKMKVLLSK